jgi:hypothetical protein
MIRRALIDKGKKPGDARLAKPPGNTPKAGAFTSKFGPRRRPRSPWTS